MGADSKTPSTQESRYSEEERAFRTRLGLLLL